MPPSNSLLDRPVRTRAPRRIAALVATACVACGPFGSLKKVATDAARAVAEVEAAGAEEYAPSSACSSVLWAPFSSSGPKTDRTSASRPGREPAGAKRARAELHFTDRSARPHHAERSGDGRAGRTSV